MATETSNVTIVSWPSQPMESTVGVRGQIPVCLRVCEPICARSDYQIGITIFDRPVATISVSGETRIFNCDEKR
jgi:hypothetical protein